MTKEDDPDYAGPEGNRLRSEAQKHAEERHQLLDASKKAFESGDKGKAKELSEKGKEAGRLMEESNKKAAAVILKHRNDGHGEHYLDLHGLYLEEALTAFREKMAVLQKSKDEIVFEVIPGAGNHSKNKAIIKPKIIEELVNNKSGNVTFEEKNAGSINVFINKGAEGAVTRAPVPPEASTASTASAAAAGKKRKAEAEEESEKAPSKMCCVVM